MGEFVPNKNKDVNLKNKNVKFTYLHYVLTLRSPFYNLTLKKLIQIVPLALKKVYAHRCELKFIFIE